MFRESRRSSRVPLKVRIEAQGVTEPLTCEGETIIVNLHGALISTAVALSVGARIEIHVYLTDKRADAKIVSILTSLGTAESNWRSPRTFGEYLCHPMTGVKAIKNDTRSEPVSVACSVEASPI